MAIATLTTLTPVHVGSGQKLLRNFDFVVQNGQIGFLDLNKILEKLGIERLPQLTAEIDKKNVSSFLIRLCRTLHSEICLRTVKTNGAISANTTELKEQFKTAIKGPCIPGSSLKGSIRTTMVSYLTDAERNNETIQRELLRQVRWDDSRRINFGTLDSQLFGSTANAKSIEDSDGR